MATTMSINADSTPVDRVRALLDGVTTTGTGWQAKCPAHEDNRASLSLSTGGDGRALIHCHAGCPSSAVVGALGLTLADLMVPTITAKPRIVATYEYNDEHDEHLFDVVRYSDKQFRQRRADHEAAGTWKMTGVRLVPYGLSELKGAASCFIPEGEKDCDRLQRIGLPATTNPAGAGKWRADYSNILKTIGITKVCILPDNDDPGRAHAEDVAKHCNAAGIEVRILPLPNLPAKGDVSDWLQAGGTRDQLLELAKAAPKWVSSETAALPKPKKPETVDTDPIRPVLARLADVEAQPVTWIWPGRIAKGKLTVVVGDPGLGKSFFTLDVAARGSTGASWPDGAKGGAPMSVLLLNAEDALDDTVRPRLDASGADVSKVHAMTAVRVADRERGVHLADVGAIEAAVVQTGAELVIIDPLAAYLAGADSHRDADVRSLLAPIAALADRRRLAVVAVMHLSKGQGQRAIYRANGSIAFTAAARIVLAVAADPENTGRRILAPVKSNLAVEADALAYRLVDGRVEWETGPVSQVDVDALLNPAPVTQAEDRTAADQVITDLLHTEEWPLDAKTAIEEGEARGVPERTMQRAAKKFGIRISRVGFGGKGRFVWHRPIDDTSTPSAPSTPRVAPMAPMENQAGKHPLRGVARPIDATAESVASMGGDWETVA